MSEGYPAGLGPEPTITSDQIWSIFEVEIQTHDGGGKHLAGMFSSLWQFSTNNTMADPGSRHYRSDNDTDPTALAVSLTDDDNVQRPQLADLLPGDHINVRSTQIQGDWGHVIVVAPPTDNGTWFLVPVVVAGAGGTAEPPKGNDRMLFDFMRIE